MHHALTRNAILAIQHGVVWALEAVVLLAISNWFETVDLTDYRTALIVILAFSAINTFVMPALLRLSVRVHPILFPIVSLALNGGVLIGLEVAVPGWDVRGWGPAILLAATLAATSTIIGGLLLISDDAAWRRFALEPLRARVQREARPSTTPGLVFLEIDGLSGPVLRYAIEKGYAPNIARWLNEGSHELTAWEPDLSSQTGASQAGILLGSNENIPAFRWYDRELRRVIVSNTLRDSELIEQRHSSGNGLLVHDGASRGNLVSGDAPDTFLTFSTVRAPRSSSARLYALFYANPYNVGRTFALYITDVVREYAAGIWQYLRNARPRVRRFGIYPWLRAATTSILRELTTFAVAGDLVRGKPVIYATWVAYDEVAHHGGVQRHDSLRVLRDLDRDIGRLQLVAETAPRPYEFVVLSDHGQSQGATFRQRWGASLREVVESAIARGEGTSVEGAVAGDLEIDEGWHSVSALLTDLLTENIPGSEVVQAALRRRIRDGEVRVGPGSPRRRWRRLRKQSTPPDYEDGKVMVLASGSLGLVYLTGWSRRLTLEEIEAHFPLLATTLLEHEGIGWLLVRSEDRGSIVLGPDGFVIVETGRVVGTNPLADYGENALHHVRRTDGFTDAPDLLIHSTYNPETGETPAFEELVGSHGGLGGYQTEPFLLHPRTLDPGTGSIIGAEELHHRLKHWTHGASSRTHGTHDAPA